MFIIGERINGMYKTVREAINNYDADFIINLAIEQIDAGADALDISVGPVKGDQSETMIWLVETVSSAVSVPLCIDSPHPDVIEAGIRAASGKTIINSLKNSPLHVEKLFPLAAETDSDIICLLMNEKGIPTDWSEKLEIAAELMTYAAEAGIEPDRLYFDPILLPVANAQKDVAETFELMDQLKILTSPPPHMIVGLSNLSQKAQHRGLLERTYCTMAMSHGLDAAILDPLDEKLMHAITAAETLLNRKLYAHSYLKT
jgi:5-methyltetrahydrofolate corrinoid/iron sulfur protein methyltransferase